MEETTQGQVVCAVCGTPVSGLDVETCPNGHAVALTPIDTHDEGHD